MDIKYIFLFLFFGTAFLDMLYVYKDVPKSRYFSKPLLMPLLLIFYLLASKSPNSFLIFALIFSFFGDLFLLWEDKKLPFIFGLFSFLFAHIFYFLTFFKSSNYFKGIPFYIYFIFIPYIIYGFYLFKFLHPEIEKIKIPILIYVFTIIIMSFSTIPRFYFFDFKEALFPFIGSILFIISDSLLALKVFK
ncbi:MAG: lysoplasmalogenase, partial [Caldisericia bacterium]|nr:lysoplasmalogenase [Caldisericia bacterium]